MRLRAVVLALLALSPLALSAQTDPVGSVIGVNPRVSRRPPQQDIKKDAPTLIYPGMQVNTYRQAGAEIAINPIDARNGRKSGKVRIGPNTAVTFNEFVVGRAQGLTPRMSLSMAFGMIQLALMPEGPVPAEGEYWIETPSVPRIRLLGTIVFVKVDRRDGSTTVAVLEGEVQIEPKVGERLELDAGQWTRIEVDRSPTPPAPIPPPGGQPDLPPFHDELLPPDPPDLFLRLDLPS